jgi:HEPN domain-containing protein
MNEETKKWFKQAQEKMSKLEKDLDKGYITEQMYNNRMTELAIYYIAACNFDDAIWGE